MKFYQSQILANLDNFRLEEKNATKLMRERVDMFLLWKTIEYFQPKNLLEIGFYAGQSAGIMLESAPAQAQLTVVDITFAKRPVFDQLFPKSSVQFIQTDSRLLQLDPNHKFDFISIDGNHEYEYVLNDLEKCLPCMHQNTILYMDDYNHQGVERVIIEKLLGQNDLVPFMFGDMAMFFHHKSHSADDFLDVWIQYQAKNFVNFDNTEKFGFLQLRAKLCNVFVDHPTLFQQVLEFYQL